jgi:vacuolar-type H+-ATPase subunit F/Vma7
MSTCALLADEVTAAGFRLAGVDVHVPDEADLAQRFERLCGEAQLVLVTADLAARLPPALLRQQQRASRTLVLVIADARGRREPEALGAALRRQLGMAE